jgi:prepilin-type N-terminal cleavage/methylation domain-containing protein/prepilin-type processing-associated H-X9-DG protein
MIKGFVKMTIRPQNKGDATMSSMEAKVPTEKLRRANNKRGFTLIEILVVVTIIGILAAILFPVFARARENARRASCMSNLKQIGLGMMEYTQDYDEKYPTQTDQGPFPYATTNTQNWIQSIYPYVKSWQLFKCPSTIDSVVAGSLPGENSTPITDSNTGYAANGLIIQSGGRSMAVIPNPAEIVLLSEFYNSYSAAFIRPMISATPAVYINWNYKGATSPGFNGLHFDGGNQAFADGHVKWRRQSAICAVDYGLQASVPSNACGPVAVNTAGATALF